MTTQNQPAAVALSRWVFDPFHTQVAFAARYLGMTTVRGNFPELSATGYIDPDAPAASSAQVTIQAASLTTHNPERDIGLRSSQFLEVDRHPTITFTSTGIAQTGRDRYTLTGDLTIKGITRPVTFAVVKYGEFTDPKLGHRLGYSAQTRINRQDFGLTFTMLPGATWLVSDEVELLIEGEFVEQGPGQQA